MTQQLVQSQSTGTTVVHPIKQPLDGTQRIEPTPFDAHEKVVRVPHTHDRVNGYQPIVHTHRRISDSPLGPTYQHTRGDDFHPAAVGTEKRKTTKKAKKAAKAQAKKDKAAAKKKAAADKKAAQAQK